MTTHTEHLDLAFACARQGPARDPNPRVGCVLVDASGQVVGRGHHAGAGTPHAEVVALTEAGRGARGATAYLTLEPCNHHGRTGPCALALFEAGVARVVYAVPDPTTRAAGGARWLAGQGVVVEQHEHPGAAELVAAWSRAARLGRPHVTWKIASTLDGRVAAADGTSRWITSVQARQDSHALRARVDAVVVGTGTALTDDPALTARAPDGTELADQPLRVVVGHRELAPGARLTTGGEPVLQLRTHDPQEVLARLSGLGVHSVLLEGGPRLAGAFWSAGCVDEVLTYLAPALLGAGSPAVPDLGITTIADIARLDLVDVRRIGPDLRLRLVPPDLAEDYPQRDRHPHTPHHPQED